MKFAFILDDKVARIEEFESHDERFALFAREFQNVVEITDQIPAPQIGWPLRGGSLVDPAGGFGFSIMSKLKFLERFTDAELAAAEAFSVQSNPYAYALRAALRKQTVAEFIDISLPQTIAGVNNLVALGLLTAQRADQILNTPLREDEKYKGLK